MAATGGRSAAEAESWSLRWCRQARTMRDSDGNMKEARLLLRSALVCGANYGCVYREWIALEEGDAGAVRKLFEAWRLHRAAARAAGCAPQDDAEFWSAYLRFERKYGGAEGAREVVRAALKACPRDAAVHAKCIETELRLGDGARARALLAQALSAFADDAATREWLMEEVRACRESVRRHSFGGILSRICHSVRRPRAPHGYLPLPA